jgi:hypothetical protein
VVSAHVSSMERKPRPLAAIAASVLSRSRQAVEAHHHEHVAGGLELTHLSSNALAVRRHVCIALSHELILLLYSAPEKPFSKLGAVCRCDADSLSAAARISRPIDSRVVNRLSRDGA